MNITDISSHVRALRPALLALALCWPFLAVGESRAALLHFDFTGTTNSITDFQNILANAGLQTGGAFSGHFIYDTASTLTDANGIVGDGQNLGDLSITLFTPTASYTGSEIGTMAIQKHNDSPIFGDRIAMNAVSAQFPAAIAGTFTQFGSANNMQVAFQGFDNPFADDTTLPSTYPNT